MTLSDKLTEHLRINELQQKALKRLGIETIRDLLYHFPARYSDISKVTPIAELVPGENATIVVRVVKAETKKAWKSKIPMAEAMLEDSSGKINAVWFHQAYIAKMLPVGKVVTLTGRPTLKNNGEIYLANAEFDRGTALPIDSHDTLFSETSKIIQEEEIENDAKNKKENEMAGVHIPIYPESRGVSSSFIHHSIEKLFLKSVLELEPDLIPKEILEKYKLPNWKTAMHWLHMPRKKSDALAARKRFAFEEVFYIQLQKAKDRSLLQSLPTQQININDKEVANFIKRFGFKLTKGQDEAVKQIFSDFKKGVPMSRLLEGDVGSGKTAVAAATAFSVVTSTPDQKGFGNLQVAYMAPTEILAGQHFESFIKFFEGLNIQIGLLTGKTARKFPAKVVAGSKTIKDKDGNITSAGWTDISKAQLLKWVANGEIPILIGTHSLIQKSVKFKHLSFVIIDEQHRFGVRQRMQLVRRTSGKDLSLETAISEAKAPAHDFLYYKDLSYRISRIITENFDKNFTSALEKENISFQNNLSVGGGKKNQLSTKIDFLIENAIAIVFRSSPFFKLSDKQKFERSLKYGNFALALVAYRHEGKLKIDSIKNPAFKKSTSAGSFTNQTKINNKKTGNSNELENNQSENKQPIPHLLSMTATPIPRTLALTIYGDLDITVLSDMPAGRLPVVTEIVPPTKRDQVYEKIHIELESGRQVYVICPRIDEPDPTKEMAMIAKSVIAEASRLKRDVFPKYNIGIMHSKMSKEKKEDVMQDFNDKKIDILCATSVVEVGVNVPNATVIIIEGAERFGLAQLHQLRGRVLRSNHQPYCYLFTGDSSKNSNKNSIGNERTIERLSALKTAKNGFELSELDLKLRGSGELAIGKQWGVSDLAMEAIKNPKMVEAARSEAKHLVESGQIANYPELEKSLGNRELHFE